MRAAMNPARRWNFSTVGQRRKVLQFWEQRWGQNPEHDEAGRPDGSRALQFSRDRIRPFLCSTDQR